MYNKLSAGTMKLGEINNQLDLFFQDYHVNVIQKTMDKVVKRDGYQSYLQENYKLGESPIEGLSWIPRLFSETMKWDSDLRVLNVLDPKYEGLRIGEDYVAPTYSEMSMFQYSKHKKVNQAVLNSQTVNETKGISIWDFDDTIAKSKSNVLYTAPDGTTGKLNAEEYARDYVDLAEQGYTFDFSEFDIVVEGEKGPFFKKFVDRIKKFGVKDNFILTARPVESAPAIREFLLSQGLDIPLSI